MPLPTDVENRLLNNSLKGVFWDTPNISFGNMNIGLSSTVPNDDGTGITPVTVSTNTVTNGSWISAAGGSTNNGGSTTLLIATNAASRGTIRAIVWYEGSGSTPRFWYVLPQARLHYLGDSFTVGNVTLRFI